MASLNVVTAYIDLLGKSSELSVVRDSKVKKNKQKTNEKKTLKALQVKTKALLLKLYTIIPACITEIRMKPHTNPVQVERCTLL